MSEEEIKAEEEVQPSEPEESSEETPGWVKKVRAINKEYSKKIKELERRLNEKTEEPIKEPTLEDCEYDSTLYANKLSKYYQDKARKTEEKIRQENENKEWNLVVKSYDDARKKHPAKDYDDAEELVESLASKEQLALIIKGANKPADVIYSLGKNPALAEKFFNITDYVKFTFEVAKYEQSLTSTRKPETKPEKIIKGGAVPKTVDKEYERISKIAEKTNDYTELVKYMRGKRNAR